MDLEDIWEKILEEVIFFFSFEWFLDIGDFFSNLFENLGEFSPIGTIYGIIMVILVYVFRGSIFVFVDTMGIVGKTIWYPIFFIFAFIAGYIMGKKIWE